MISYQGFGGAYKQRAGGKDDGCAMFYNKAKFDCVFRKKINLNVGKGVLQRDNVAILMMLRPKTSMWAPLDPGKAPVAPPAICVVTTHILFNMKRGDVKLAQLAYILAAADRLIEEYRGDAVTNAGMAYQDKPVGGIIFSGDFNLEPFSPLYEYLLRGSLVSSAAISGEFLASASFSPYLML